MTDLTLEELAKLDGLSAEVTRCQAIADAGNDGFYMQVTYAEEALGRAMVENRDALLAMARELHRLRDALTFLLHARDPDFDYGTKTGAEIELMCAKRMGWPDPLPPSERKGEG